jgi:hypothetical protein
MRKKPQMTLEIVHDDLHPLGALIDIGERVTVTAKRNEETDAARPTLILWSSEERGLVFER